MDFYFIIKEVEKWFSSRNDGNIIHFLVFFITNLIIEKNLVSESQFWIHFDRVPTAHAVFVDALQKCHIVRMRPFHVPALKFDLLKLRTYC